MGPDVEHLVLQAVFDDSPRDPYHSNAKAWLISRYAKAFIRAFDIPGFSRGD